VSQLNETCDLGQARSSLSSPAPYRPSVAAVAGVPVLELQPQLLRFAFVFPDCDDGDNEDVAKDDGRPLCSTNCQRHHAYRMEKPAPTQTFVTTHRFGLPGGGGWTAISSTY
jgi:hypothetical protein